MPAFEIKLQISWHAHEADGSTCCICGEPCWSPSWQLFVSSDKVMSCTPVADLIVCDACFDEDDEE